ncbi:DEAD/DEAH box helicase [Streptomyces tauricus]|uniref:DEAD/DEAH box helicase n=1 Tax=Streptomyces tauricus TaxID=68274 RepID=UPI00387F2A51
MPLRTVDLLGPINLLPGKSLDVTLRQKARDHPGLPRDAGQLVADLRTHGDGVPTTFKEPRRADGDWSLLIHGRTYVAQLYLTKRQADAYTIARIDPLRMADHTRLAQGCLLLRPTLWQLCFEYRQIPRGSDSHWQRLVKEWQCLGEGLAAERGAAPLRAHHTAFLDTLDRMIDATEAISLESVKSASPFPFRSVGATGGQRHGTRAVYEFRIAGEAMPDEGAFVQIRGEPERRGQVTRVASEDGTVTVRFDQPVDWASLDQQGELVVTPSAVVYDKQREAVALVRTGQARSPRLLETLVDHKVRGIRPRSDAPAEDLDADQLDAFRKALAVEDMLLVQGPPGTGKTRSITEIAGGVAGSGRTDQPVLVTSHTHRAVDNVVSRLPRDLVVVRVGNEGKVTDEGKPYLLERQAAELREEILGAVGLRKNAHAGVGLAQQWAHELDGRLERLGALLADETRSREEHAAARRAVGGPAQARVDELTAERARRQRSADRHQRRLDRLHRVHQRALHRTAWWLIGALFRLLATVYDRRMTAARQTTPALQDALRQVRDDLAAAQHELDETTKGNPTVQAARRALEKAERLTGECRDQARTAAWAARAAVPAAEAPPSVPANADHDDLIALRSWLAERLPLLATRQKLLAEWHDEVSGAADQLYPELIRYAHVIAATCIGTASRPELSGIDFDLAIVDEAGQIGMTDALVPLVRARRAVLVGDHQQLPPFLDSEVETWGKSVGDPAITRLLAASALETLMSRLPDSHRVLLTSQRRMPPVIADFISDTFYDGQLRTAVRREHRDPLFRTPMAFVDTSDLPTDRRYEQKGRAGERFGQRGYTNRAEAKLLADLAAFYHARGVEWAVIVPYRAQRAEIAASLARRVDPAHVSLNVGTVDSFQGGERDVILYGFTRSNPYGEVGFLKELRRANVAFTRAKHQLVLVGDLSTLSDARDAGFRELTRSLKGHLDEHGEIRAYKQVSHRLAALAEEGERS